MSVISMKQLLEAGCHFGHPTRKWNPKMKKYIFTARNDIHILNLEDTSKQIDEAYVFIKEKVLAECIQDISTQCADRFMEMVFPVKLIKVQGVAVWINAGQDRAVAGEFYNVYRLGEEFIDPDTGESLGADEEFVCQVKVEQAKQKYSIANVVTGTAPTGNLKQYILRKCTTEQAAPAPEQPAPIPGNDQTNPF